MNSEQRKRLFIGIGYKPGRVVRQILYELRDMEKKRLPGLRPIAEENLHVTLKFLGMVPEPEIAMLCQIMPQVARRHAPMKLKLCGCGRFDKSLWLGIADHDQLRLLVKDLDQALTIIGMESEKKPFVPHMTIARLRANASSNLPGLLADCGDREWDVIEVENLHLFESETLPEGARYTKVFSATLDS